MSGVRSLHRGPLAKGPATGASAPIRVDDSTNQVRVIAGGPGSTAEVPVPTGADAPITLTASATLAPTTQAGIPIVYNNVAGGTITLPNATGSGQKYYIWIGTTLTSGSFVVQVGRNADYFRGAAYTVGAAQASFLTANTGTLATESDTMTWNRSTTGLGTIGDFVELWDIAVNVWSIEAEYASSGSAATPFSAAV